MLRIAGNFFRSVLYASLGTLIGYYNFQVNGVIGLVTNLTFLALGILAVTTWKRSIERNSCVRSSGPQSLSETPTDADVVSEWERIDKGGTNG